MDAFTRPDAKIAPLPLANIDTDQIIPKQFLKTVEREGLAKGLFYDLRFDPDGKASARASCSTIPPECRGAGVLIAGDNFGCGSSPANMRPGPCSTSAIRCVIASGFADIFYNNCFQNGLLPIVLPRGTGQGPDGAEAKGGNHVWFRSTSRPRRSRSRRPAQAFAFDIDPQPQGEDAQGIGRHRRDPAGGAADIDTL